MNENSRESRSETPVGGSANPQPNTVTGSSATVVVADEKPLSLLTTAGILHHAGMRCMCARTADAVMRACGMPRPPSADTILTEVEEIASEVAEAVEPLRVDKPNPGVVAANNTAIKPGNVDLLVWDVGGNPMLALQTLEQIRERFPELPAVLLAESKWAGLEKKTEQLSAATRCLFKPIDPSALIAVCEPLLWMPALQSVHRLRGSRPNRPGWVTL